MNPYKYSDPPFGIDLLESPTKLKTTIWPEKKTRLHGKNNICIYFIFCIGVCLGYLLTNFLREYLLRANICSSGYFNEGIVQQSIVPETKDLEKYSNYKKNVIYIGIMTANKYLNTRAKTVYETWGKHVPGNIEFFTSEMSHTDEDIPVVKLKGVDDVYPPQKKSFMMLKYMHDNHLNDYEYFMRADDDVYIRTDRLEKFLKSINSSKLYYIGQPGQGGPTELGQLSLKEKENFCMGGPGMIFTKATLEKFVPHIKKCLKNLKSFHEDVEVGRCVQKYAGISCTWSYEMQSIFYHNTSESKAFTGSLNQKEVHQAITLHPIKNHHHLYRLHAYTKSLLVKEKEYEIIQAMREIHMFAMTYNLKLPSFDNALSGMFLNHLGTDPSLQTWKPNSESEVLEWDFLMQNSYQLADANPKHRMTSFVKDSHSDLIRDTMETINRLSKERGRVIDFKDTLYGYSRHNPCYASEYIFDMLLLYKKYRGKKMTLAVRRHAYLQVPFGPLYVKEKEGITPPEERVRDRLSFFRKGLNNLVGWSFKTSNVETSRAEKEVIHFVVPVAGKTNAFRRFMGDFQRVCLERGEPVGLIVVSFRPPLGEEDSSRLAESLLFKLSAQYAYAKMAVVQSNSSFARASALQLGAEQVGPEGLLFFVDVDISFTASALDRIRFHTIPGKQVYYPIVFSQFDPKNIFDEEVMPRKQNLLQVDEESGFWRVFGFGIVSMYKADLVRVGGFNTSIVGWGKEDIDLYEKVLKYKELQVMRTRDPGLVHVFHRVTCDPKLEEKQLAMCHGSLFNTYKSVRTLTRTVLQRPEILMFQRTRA